ncbi:MAG: carboxylesterase/lipase family protein [Anaerolineae bacterium]
MDQAIESSSGERPRLSLNTSSTAAVVRTSAGKVRGYIRNGIYTFKGIPYGAPTGGAARFMPPSRPSPWSGVRSCLHYGHTCPQLAFKGSYLVTGGDNAPVDDEDAFLLYRAYLQPAGEDCLRLNIWTPAIHTPTRYPVMVWLHGGGFEVGSGHDLAAYDGEALATRGDVVVITLNHRLGVFGHLNLAEVGGEPYAGSGNVGLLDIVLALEWVQENIVNFGGDPGNVMIFGQSGGGGKVNALMAMPAAGGLFHRAAVQSGSTLRVGEPENTARLAAAVLAELGVEPAHLEALQQFTVQELLAAGRAAVRGLADEARREHGRSRLGWTPTVDGGSLPRHPFDPDAPDVSADVPLLVGTNLHEFVCGVDRPDAYSLTGPELVQQLRARYGEGSEEILSAYQRCYPDAKPFDLLAFISVAPFRQSAVDQATRKAAQGKAPAYYYLFSWRTPVLDGRPGAFHSAEIAFVFDNLERCSNLTGGDPEADILAGRMSQAWINFARYGDPNHDDLPHWPAFTSEEGATMRFDSPCAVVKDPDRAARQVVLSRG